MYRLINVKIARENPSFSFLRYRVSLRREKISNTIWFGVGAVFVTLEGNMMNLKPNPNPEQLKTDVKVECSRCGDKELKKVHSFNDGSDNIDNFPHYHLECLNCGCNFGMWGLEVSIEKLKKAYGEVWEQYS